MMSDNRKEEIDVDWVVGCSAHRYLIERPGEMVYEPFHEASEYRPGRNSTSTMSNCSSNAPPNSIDDSTPLHAHEGDHPHVQLVGLLGSSMHEVSLNGEVDTNTSASDDVLLLLVNEELLAIHRDDGDGDGGDDDAVSRTRHTKSASHTSSSSNEWRRRLHRVGGDGDAAAVLGCISCPRNNASRSQAIDLLAIITRWSGAKTYNVRRVWRDDDKDNGAPPARAKEGAKERG